MPWDPHFFNKTNKSSVSVQSKYSLNLKSSLRWLKNKKNVQKRIFVILKKVSHTLYKGFNVAIKYATHQILHQQHIWTMSLKNPLLFLLATIYFPSPNCFWDGPQMFRCAKLFHNQWPLWYQFEWAFSLSYLSTMKSLPLVLH